MYKKSMMENSKEDRIQKIESLVRNSYEYILFIMYFRKKVLNDNRCKVTNKNGKLEFHHSPLTLYEIVETMINKDNELNTHYDDIDIAKNVIRLHYQFKVGLIPIETNVHKVLHRIRMLNDKSISDLNPDLVLFNWKKFIEENKKYLSKNALIHIEQFEKFTIDKKDFEELFMYQSIKKKKEGDENLKLLKRIKDRLLKE